jgi:hypothetical protein
MLKLEMPGTLKIMKLVGVRHHVISLPSISYKVVVPRIVEQFNNYKRKQINDYTLIKKTLLMNL